MTGPDSGARLPAADREAHMRVALESARRALLAGEPPVGACLVRAGQVVVTTHNAVVAELDITAHAEMLAIRYACRELRTLELADCEMFVTVEPCAMCLAACHYAGISRVTFGADLDELQRVTRRELGERPSWRSTPVPVPTEGGCLAAECRALLADWAQRP